MLTAANAHQAATDLRPARGCCIARSKSSRKPQIKVGQIAITGTVALSHRPTGAGPAAGLERAAGALDVWFVTVLQGPWRAFVHAAGDGEDALRLNATVPAEEVSCAV
jgi:hypothetical protein